MHKHPEGMTCTHCELSRCRLCYEDADKRANAILEAIATPRPATRRAKDVAENLIRKWLSWDARMRELRIEIERMTEARKEIE